MATNAKWLNKVRWDEHGLVPVIAQEAATGDILMFAWMNRDALARTVPRDAEGSAHHHACRVGERRV